MNFIIKNNSKINLYVQKKHFFPKYCFHLEIQDLTDNYQQKY